MIEFSDNRVFRYFLKFSNIFQLFAYEIQKYFYVCSSLISLDIRIFFERTRSDSDTIFVRIGWNRIFHIVHNVHMYLIIFENSFKNFPFFFKIWKN